MFSHLFLGSNDLAKAKVFYDALFAAIGGPEGLLIADRGRLIYAHKGSKLILATPNNGEAATIANGGTVGFAIDTAEQVEAWHAAGVAHGGTAIENAPGVRPAFNAYLAYLRDPDGHKLCALCQL
ncbi:VOC family protein [Novosphingobium umbonatum]|uniref:VOC family protein n=1 Tax=Novosphingobium umbonatum TaxID=1908524 RepID=A0A437N5D7_9SPHN|nr:VOC family protein [Novosphingobium umbonatum]RVU05071.1 VOC family protein [Novosphingobium umbonatum]